MTYLTRGQTTRKQWPGNKSDTVRQQDKIWPGDKRDAERLQDKASPMKPTPIVDR